jgi:hypothetical protein
MTKEQLLEQILAQPTITKEYVKEVGAELMAINDDDFWWVCGQISHGGDVCRTENAKAMVIGLGPDDAIYQRLLSLRDVMVHD